jgi:hypothetical protein
MVQDGWWWGSVRERTPGGLRSGGREVDGAAVDAGDTVLALAPCRWIAVPLPYGELVGAIPS